MGEKPNSNSTGVPAACHKHHDSTQTRVQRVHKIELLLCITSILLIYLFIVGPLRRRYRHAVLGRIGVLVYTLSSSLILYTLALMQNAPFCYDMFPLWGAFLLMVQDGGVDTFSTYSIENNEQWRSSYLQYVYHAYSFVSLLIINVAAQKPPMFLVTMFVFLLMGLKATERVICLRSASKSALQQNFKHIADYMSKEHDNSKERDNGDKHAVDPISMRGYKYAVTGKEADPQGLITLEKVWDCKGWLLSSSGGDPRGHLKDICLSFSLFKLLILKYAGYSMPRRAYQKTWRLIRRGLISSSDGTGHERVFRVIELELAFLFDLFYTKHRLIVLPLLWALKSLHFMIFLAVSMATAKLLFSKYSHVEHPINVFHAPPHVYVTVMVMLIYAAVEFFQLLFTFLFSEWAKVMWLCKYVKLGENWRGKRYFEKLLEKVCRHRFFPWDGNLGQYSLVGCFSYCPPKIFYNWCTSHFYDQARDGQREIAPTKLTEQVKREIIRSLTMNGSKNLNNGLSSLRRNGVLDELAWACNLETQTQVIMVWHVATFFCEHEVPPHGQQKENFETATKLSKYLAYLVVFAPRMLPNHPYVTQLVFNQVVIEARRFFEGCESLQQKIQKLRREGDPKDETVVGCAVRLGQQLVKQISDPESNEVRDGGFILRILAEFWAELALYVAPSDDIEIHLKHLALGGEFVTHLWALLYHAGIEKRRAPRPPKRYARLPPPLCEDEGVQGDAPRPPTLPSLSVQRAAPPSPPTGEDEGVQRDAPRPPTHPSPGVQKAAHPSPPAGQNKGIQRAAPPPPPGEDEDEHGVR